MCPLPYNEDSGFEVRRTHFRRRRSGPTCIPPCVSSGSIFLSDFSNSGLSRGRMKFVLGLRTWTTILVIHRGDSEAYLDSEGHGPLGHFTDPESSEVEEGLRVD